MNPAAARFTNMPQATLSKMRVHSPSKDGTRREGQSVSVDAARRSTNAWEALLRFWKKGKMAAHLTKDGGYAIPNGSAIARAMRDYLKKFLNTHGEVGLLPKWMENNAYNFYLKDMDCGRSHPLALGQASP